MICDGEGTIINSAMALFIFHAKTLLTPLPESVFEKGFNPKYLFQEAKFC